MQQRIEDLQQVLNWVMKLIEEGKDAAAIKGMIEVILEWGSLTSDQRALFHHLVEETLG